MADNYNDVLGQFREHGLIVSDIIPTRLVRCKVDGDREKRGWYVVHEIALENGSRVLVGTYGIWQGNDPGTVKIKLGKDYATSDEDKKLIRQRMAEDKKRAENDRKRRAEIASLRAEKMWRQLSSDGHAEYLTRKQIKAYDIRFTKKNAIALPVRDYTGVIHGLQFILDKTQHKDKIAKQDGRDKTFWPPNIAKKGHFFMFGGIPAGVILVCEGYATGASLHEATGIPVIVAFDAGNLEPVVTVIQEQYPRTGILICADDDDFGKCMACKAPVLISKSDTCQTCGEPHKRTNAGVSAAIKACTLARIRWIIPRFPDEAARFAHYANNKGKLTDFNDLHCLASLNTVRLQIESAVKAYYPNALKAAASNNPPSGGDADPIRPIDTTEELLERYALVYGRGGVVFDFYERVMVALSDMRDACQSRDVARRWQESPHRQIVRPDNVGFDPACTDPLITCNLYKGLDSIPVPGSCETMLELVMSLCSGEENTVETTAWLLKWLAYPLQHPGAKMRSTVVVHSEQGVGKNIFFEQVMKIYGRYGSIIDQSALEDKHNEWASAKLFLIADEVVARSDLYHIKNKLKQFITGENIRINPKNIMAYNEKNHVNIVFLSNEQMPVLLERGDRRHCVLWAPAKKEPEFYKKLAHELDHGLISHFHHYLLNLPLGDFDEHSPPPLTEAKKDLISLSQDSILRFYDEWQAGEIADVPLVPALREDIYNFYRIWCGKQGVKAGPMHHVMARFGKITTVDRNGKAVKVQKGFHRYAQGPKSGHQTFFFIPGCKEMDPGGLQAYFLGDCVRDFRDAVNDYRVTE